jgi:hypothetical protein
MEDRAMPTATSEKIRSRLEHLDASVQAIRRHLLEECATVLEAQRGMRQDLRDGLREGMEKEALLGTLGIVRSRAEGAVETLGKARALFGNDSQAGPAIESGLRETEEFLAWVRDLEARLSGIPPFDASRLTPAPAGPTAEGYVSVREARNRARAGKKP